MAARIGGFIAVVDLGAYTATGSVARGGCRTWKNRRDGGREGAFWEVMAGRRAPPPAAVLLGWKLVDIDPDNGTIDVAFSATDQFLNPAGDVQGGFLAAMLDDTMGPALVATLEGDEWAPTIDLQVQFLAPAKPGELRAHGRVIRRGRDIAFLAGELRDSRDRLVATATASALIRRRRT